MKESHDGLNSSLLKDRNNDTNGNNIKLLCIAQPCENYFENVLKIINYNEKLYIFNKKVRNVNEKNAFRI